MGGGRREHEIRKDLLVLYGKSVVRRIMVVVVDADIQDPRRGQANKAPYK